MSNQLLNAARTGFTKSTALSLAKENIVDSIWKAANIEGLGTDLEDVDSILRDYALTTKKSEVLFVLNMYDAWDFLFNNLDYNNCWMLLSELNKIVGYHLINRRGELRKSEVYISGTSWAPSIPVESEVYDSIALLNKIEDPVDKALSYFCYLTKAQLFIDGNKRVAQLMANKILIENNIGILSVPVECLNGFRDNLISYYETGIDSTLKNFLKHKCIRYV